jgi:hypothetical protein
MLIEVIKFKSLITDDDLKKLLSNLYGHNEAIQVGDIEFKLKYKNLNIIRSLFVFQPLEELRQLWLKNPITYAIQFNNTYVISCLIETGYDPSEDDNMAIQLASINGDLNIVKTLLLDPAGGMEPQIIYHSF